jgi:hypothetical protein
MGSKLLIAAGEAARGADELPPGVRALVEGAEEILVVAPSLPTRFEWLASATNRSREQADERLQVVLGQIGDLGSEARGMTGSDDPIQALDDAIRAFDPDHLLIAIRAAPDAGWQERGLIEQVLERFGLPVTVFPVGD